MHCFFENENKNAIINKTVQWTAVFILTVGIDKKLMLFQHFVFRYAFKIE